MDRITKSKLESGFRRGILKTSMANVERIMSRSRDNSGKVYSGEAGQQLLRRKLEVQAYYERNRTR
jgi:hypothetical protein